MKIRKQNSMPLPSEYDYLDTLDHDGWRWEFMRKLPPFRSDYESVKDKCEYQGLPEWWNLGEKYSMTKQARDKFSCLNPSRPYSDLPSDIKPIFEGTEPIKSLHREKLLKEIRRTLKLWSYGGKDNPILHFEPEQYMLLAVEMSIRPGMFPRNVEYMGINLDASRTDLREAFEAFLKTHIRPKTGKGDEKMYFGAHKTALIVWDLRAQRKTFPEIQKITGMDKDTAKKKFYRAYELIYGKPYDPSQYERPAVYKTSMIGLCSDCKQWSTCRVLCPDAIAFVDQDTRYQRDMTFGDTDIMTKRAMGFLDTVEEEETPISDIPEDPDDDRS